MTSARTLVAAKGVRRRGRVMVLELKRGGLREVEVVFRPEIMWRRVRVEHERGVVWVEASRALMADMVGAFRDLPEREAKRGQKRWASTPGRHAAILAALEDAARRPRVLLRTVLRENGVPPTVYVGHVRRGGALREAYEAAVRAAPVRPEWRKLARQWDRDRDARLSV